MIEQPLTLSVQDDTHVSASGTRRAARVAILTAALGLAACTNQAPRPAYPAIEATPGSSSATSASRTLSYALRAHYREWRGVPYRYGGRDENGIDCSSFVRQTFSALESLDLPRTTSAQARAGHAINRAQLAPGDLVFFKTGRGSRHVGIYVGDGRFMHASTSRGVTISRLDNIYWRHHYWQSRRIATTD